MKGIFITLYLVFLHNKPVVETATHNLVAVVFTKHVTLLDDSQNGMITIPVLQVHQPPGM